MIEELLNLDPYSEWPSGDTEVDVRVSEADATHIQRSRASKGAVTDTRHQIMSGHIKTSALRAG